MFPTPVYKSLQISKLQSLSGNNLFFLAENIVLAYSMQLNLVKCVVNLKRHILCTIQLYE